MSGFKISVMSQVVLSEFIRRWWQNNSVMGKTELITAIRWQSEAQRGKLWTWHVSLIILSISLFILFQWQYFNVNSKAGLCSKNVWEYWQRSSPSCNSDAQKDCVLHRGSLSLCWGYQSRHFACGMDRNVCAYSPQSFIFFSCRQSKWPKNKGDTTSQKLKYVFTVALWECHMFCHQKTLFFYVFLPSFIKICLSY